MQIFRLTQVSRLAELIAIIFYLKWRASTLELLETKLLLRLKARHKIKQVSLNVGRS